ncbi:MAG: N-acetylmuramoyl-L-alanine amidase [Eubacterium sp.]|nr:N-acetylmuramoyl-L-alanine amidase [Eubacterium sp.]
MRDKFRRITSYLLVVFLVFALAGCGSSSSDSETDTQARRDDWGETTEVTEEKTTEKKTTEEKTTEATTAQATVTDSSDASDDEDDNQPSNSDTSNGESTKSTGGKLIVLDPGHSNIVTGNSEPLGPGSGEMKAADSTGTHGTTSGLSEIELNFQVATQLKAELEARGYTVLMTRYDNDTAISCSERAQVANNAGADAFIRIHADGSESSSSSGAMAICITPSNPYTASTYSESRKLSDAVLNAYVASTGFSSRGVWETDTMTGNNWSEVPCTLIEMGFMTNPNEDSLMADPSFQQKIVTGIANGIDNYFAN